MDIDVLARALHVFGVVLWIGGVGFVTTVLLPAVRQTKDPAERIAAFEAAENRFALQARVTTVIVGLTGFYMVEVYDLWDRFSHIEYWWMHGMVIIWVIFTVVLFIAEPLFLHRWFLARATEKPDETFTLVQRLHWVLLSVSLIIVLAAVVGAHGG